MSSIEFRSNGGGGGPSGVVAQAIQAATKSDYTPEQLAALQQANEVAESIRMKKGGMTASKRADGIAQRGKTRGKMV